MAKIVRSFKVDETLDGRVKLVSSLSGRNYSEVVLDSLRAYSDAWLRKNYEKVKKDNV